MTITITETVRDIPIPLVLTPKNSANKALDKLATIFGKFSEWNDPLSQRVFSWGVSTLEKIEDPAEEEAFIKLAMERTDELMREILINPIDGQPLKEPVLEHTWTWERWIHTDYRHLFNGISPLDGGPMENDPPPHLFAQEMLQWAHRFVPAILPSYSIVPFSYGALNRDLVTEPAVRHHAYKKLAKRARKFRQNQQFCEAMETRLRDFNQNTEQMRRTNAQMSVWAQEDALQHEADISQRIAAIDHTYRETLSGLENEIASTHQAHRDDIASLEKRIASVDQAHSEVAVTLQAQIGSLQVTHRNTIAALHQQITAQDLLRRAEISRVEGQLASTVKAHDVAMTSASNQHKTEVTKLESTLTQTHHQLDQTNQTLNRAQEYSAQLAANIQHLNNVVAEEKSRCQRLQHAARRAKDRSCIVM
jgi:hypothetical protein